MTTVRPPWKYIRRHLAAQWHVPPWLVEESPVGEIELELQLAHIEATVKPLKKAEPLSDNF